MPCYTIYTTDDTDSKYPCYFYWSIPVPFEGYENTLRCYSYAGRIRIFSMSMETLDRQILIILFAYRSPATCHEDRFEIRECRLSPSKIDTRHRMQTHRRSRREHVLRKQRTGIGQSNILLETSSNSLRVRVLLEDLIKKMVQTDRLTRLCLGIPFPAMFEFMSKGRALQLLDMLIAFVRC